MYGAYGQPLPPVSSGEPYRQPSLQPQYLLHSTAGPYPAHCDHGPPTASPNKASRGALLSRKISHPGPHLPSLPPPHPGSASQAPHQGKEERHVYPTPISSKFATLIANTATPYYSEPLPAQPYLLTQSLRQVSQKSFCRDESSYTSFSPCSQAPTIPGIPPAHYHTAPAPPPSQVAAVIRIPNKDSGRKDRPYCNSHDSSILKSLDLHGLLNASGRDPKLVS
jgi:hypothetical protein